MGGTSLSQMTGYFVVVTIYDKLQSAGQLELVEFWSLISISEVGDHIYSKCEISFFLTFSSKF